MKYREKERERRRTTDRNKNKLEMKKNSKFSKNVKKLLSFGRKMWLDIYGNEVDPTGEARQCQKVEK